MYNMYFSIFFIFFYCLILCWYPNNAGTCDILEHINRRWYGNRRLCMSYVGNSWFFSIFIINQWLSFIMISTDSPTHHSTNTVLKCRTVFEISNKGTFYAIFLFRVNFYTGSLDIYVFIRRIKVDRLTIINIIIYHIYIYLIVPNLINCKIFYLSPVIRVL